MLTKLLNLAKSGRGPVLFSLVSRSIAYETPQRVLQRLQTTGSNTGLARQDPLTGNVFLHDAARGLMTVNEFEQKILTVGEANACALAKIKNNQGLLPLSMIRKESLCENQQNIKTRLERLTRQHDQKPLFEPIDFDEVLSQYHGLALPEYKKKDLLLGCLVVNIIRELKLQSLTHSSVNDMSMKEFVSIGQKLMVARALSFDGINSTLQHYPSQDFKKKQLALLDDETKHIFHYKAGNCHEYTMLALYMLITEYNKDCAEAYRMTNADHTYAMFGRVNGEEGIVVDAHQGDVYLERDIENRLMGSEKVPMDKMNAYDNSCRIITSYNSKFHQSESTFSLSYNAMHFRKPVRAT